MLSPMLLLFAAQIEITPQDDLWGTLQALQPGDEVIIHAGDYPVPGFVDIKIPGTEAMPVIVRAADGETPVIVGIDSQNTFNVSGTWYTLRGLEIAGGSHGVRLGSSAHAVIEDLHIHNTLDVGISCNRPDNTYEDITIRRNHIHDTGGGGPGEGMYLGCNDGACKMWDSLVEFNYVHNTTGGDQGDGIEFKTGSYNTVVRHNVIHDTKYPGLTMYGTQGMPANTVEGNVVWNVEDNGIQTVGDLVLRNNIVFNVGASGIASKASQGEAVVNLTVVHNTVIGAGDACYRGNNFDAGDAITVANNAFFCEGGTAIKLAQGAGPASLLANAVLGSDESGSGFDATSLGASFLDAAAMNVYPAAASPLIDAGDPGSAPAEDFNCQPRTGIPDVGAYDYSTPDNPGWTIQPGFKTCEGVDPDTDSDTGDTGDTTDPTDPSGSTGSADATGSASDSASITDPGTDGSASAGETAAEGGSDAPTSGASDTPTSAGDGTVGSTPGGSTGDTAPVDTAGEGGDGCQCDTSSAPLSMSALLLVPLLVRRRRR